MVYITNGLLMLLSFVKHQNEFDRNVKFPELDNAIGQIDIAMKDFSDIPNNKLSEARSLNEHARLSYHRSVSPVVGWCNVAIGNFAFIIPHIKNESLSNEKREFMFGLIGDTLHEGLEKTAQSIEILNDVQNKSSRVVNLFGSFKHDVYDDYVKQKTNLDAKVRAAEEEGQYVFLAISNFFTNSITEKMNQLKAQINNIEEKLKDISKKIEMATEISKTGVNPNLERDDTNLSSLRGKTGDADNTKNLLTVDSQSLRIIHADVLQELTTQCRDYNQWHEVHI